MTFLNHFLDYLYRIRINVVFMNCVWIFPQTRTKTVEVGLVISTTEYVTPSVKRGCGNACPKLHWTRFTDIVSLSMIIDVIKWKHFPRYWPFVWGIHRSPVNSPHKGQWRGALMFSLICTRINGWVNNGEAGDLRRYRVHYDVIVMDLGMDK